MYASSSTTSTGSFSKRWTTCSSITLPSGLFGEVKNSSLGLCFATASSMPSTSNLNPGALPRWMSITRPSMLTRQTEWIFPTSYLTVDVAVEFVHAKCWRRVYYLVARFQYDAHKQVNELKFKCQIFSPWGNNQITSSAPQPTSRFSKGTLQSIAWRQYI